MIECHPLDQIFSHLDLEGVTRHFNCGAMTRAVITKRVRPTVIKLALYPRLVTHIRENHGIEADHLGEIDENLETPIIVVEFQDGANLIVDGNHRVVRRWDKGLRDTWAAVLKPGQWEEFLVTDLHIPQEVYAPHVQTTPG